MNDRLRNYADIKRADMAASTGRHEPGLFTGISVNNPAHSLLLASIQRDFESL